MTHLVLRARRVVCCGTGRDGPATISIRDGRVASVVDHWVSGELASGQSTGDAEQGGRGRQIIDLETGVLCPGLVDLHAHVDTSGQSRFGVCPDQFLLPTGATTIGSQGDVGAWGVALYQSQTIARSTARIRLAINLSAIGESDVRGSFAVPEHSDIDACVAAVSRHRDAIWAIAVNVSHHACGQTSPHDVLQSGLAVAAQTELPLLVGLRRPEDWPLRDQLNLLRQGDVVTYCYRREPHCFVDFERRVVLPEVRHARERGVVFDVGHGRGSFDFGTAEIAIADGFPPDTISSDFQVGHLEDAIPHSLLRTMAKLEVAGMTWKETLAATTDTPAHLLTTTADEAPFGRLIVGGSADFVVLSDPPAATNLFDHAGESRDGRLRGVELVVSQGTVIGRS